MPTTYNGFYYPDASTSLTPLASILAAMAASSDAAYKKTPAVFDTIAARDAAITTPTDGRIVYTKDYDILWHYAGGWRPVGTPVFASTTARDAAITSPVASMRCFVGSGSSLAEYTYSGTEWVIRYETGWVNESSKISAGFTGTLYTRRDASGVWVRWSLTGSIAANSSYVQLAAGIRATGTRPAYDVFGSSSLGGGYSGCPKISPSGSLWEANRTSSTTTTFIGNLYYPIG